MSRCVNCGKENRSGCDVCGRCRDEYEEMNEQHLNTTEPRGLCRLSDGAEMGSVTVPAQDAVFLRRA